MTPATVYVIKAAHGVKVGLTIMPIKSRHADLERATGLPLTVEATFPFEDRSQAYVTEQAAHWLLRDSRLTGEWFSCSAEEATQAVTQVIERGVPLDYFARGDVA